MTPVQHIPIEWVIWSLTHGWVNRFYEDDDTCYLLGDYTFRNHGYTFRIHGYGKRIHGYTFRNHGYTFRNHGYTFRIHGYSLRTHTYNLAFNPAFNLAIKLAPKPVFTTAIKPGCAVLRTTPSNRAPERAGHPVGQRSLMKGLRTGSRARKQENRTLLVKGLKP